MPTTMPHASIILFASFYIQNGVSDFHSTFRCAFLVREFNVLSLIDKRTIESFRNFRRIQVLVKIIVTVGCAVGNIPFSQIRITDEQTHLNWALDIGAIWVSRSWHLLNNQRDKS